MVYHSPQYTPGVMVQKLHSLIRLGKSNDISNLYSPNTVDHKNYLIGAAWISVTLLLLLTIWTLLILCFKFCFGRHSVGFLSGHPFVILNEKSSECIVEGKEKKKRSCSRCLPRRPARIRIVFELCATAIFVSAVLLGKHGFKGMQSTVLDLRQGTTMLHRVLVEGANITTSVSRLGSNTKKIQKQAFADLDNYCHNTDISTALNLNVTQLTTALNDLNDFIYRYMEGMTDAIIESRDASQAINETIDRWYNVVWGYVPYTFLLLLTTASLMIGVLLVTLPGEPSKQLEVSLTYGVLPVFVVFIYFTWIMACTALSGAIMNADACAGGGGKYPEGPDGTIFAITNDQLNFDPKSFQYKSVDYFVGGCQSNIPFIDISKHSIDIQAGIDTTQEIFANANNIGITKLSQNCGKDLSPILDAFHQISDNLIVLLRNIQRTSNLLTCQRINPIYVKLSHEGICTDSVQSMAWIGMCMLVIGVCGMIMIMFRSAWLTSISSLGDSSLKLEQENDVQRPMVSFVRNEDGTETEKEDVGFSLVGDGDDDDDDGGGNKSRPQSMKKGKSESSVLPSWGREEETEEHKPDIALLSPASGKQKKEKQKNESDDGGGSSEGRRQIQLLPGSSNDDNDANLSSTCVLPSWL